MKDSYIAKKLAKAALIYLLLSSLPIILYSARHYKTVNKILTAELTILLTSILCFIGLLLFLSEIYIEYRSICNLNKSIEKINSNHFKKEAKISNKGISKKQFLLTTTGIIIVHLAAIIGEIVLSILYFESKLIDTKVYVILSLLLLLMGVFNVIAFQHNTVVKNRLEKTLIALSKEVNKEKGETDPETINRKSSKVKMPLELVKAIVIYICTSGSTTIIYSLKYSFSLDLTMFLPLLATFHSIGLGLTIYDILREKKIINDLNKELKEYHDVVNSQSTKDSAGISESKFVFISSIVFISKFISSIASIAFSTLYFDKEKINIHIYIAGILVCLFIGMFSDMIFQYTAELKGELSGNLSDTILEVTNKEDCINTSLLTN